MTMPRNHMNTGRGVAVYGALELDIAGERAAVGENEIMLQQSDWAILARLAEAGGAFVRGTELLAEIWGEDMRDDTAFLGSWVQRLNGRLGPCCSGRPLIETTTGGYRLLSPAEWGSGAQRAAD